MLKFLEKLFGENNEAKIKALQSTLEEINSLEAELSKLSDDELKGKVTDWFCDLLDSSKDKLNAVGSLVKDNLAKVKA